MHMHMYHEYESVYEYGSNAFELITAFIYQWNSFDGKCKISVNLRDFITGLQKMVSAQGTVDLWSYILLPIDRYSYTL